MLSDARYEAALPCSNLDRAKSFYADKLGLTPAGRTINAVTERVGGYPRANARTA